MEQNTNLNKEAGHFATVYKLASAIMLTVLIAVGGIAFALFFDPESSYFISSPVVTAFYVIIATMVIFALSAFFMFKGNTVALPSHPTNRVTAALSAIAAAVPFIYYIYSDVSAKIAASQAPQGTLDASYGGLETIPTLILVFAAISLISSLYLVIRDSKIAALIACYARVIFLALIITKLYLDFSVELNSPVKIFVQFGAVFAMLATTAYLRPIIGKKKAASFMLTQFLSTAMCLLCFILFLTEIAPHFTKYTTDLFAFPLMLAVLGLESMVNLFTCKIEEQAAPAEAQANAGDNATVQNEVEADGTADEADQIEADQIEATEEESDDLAANESQDSSSPEGADEANVTSPAETSHQ